VVVLREVALRSFPRLVEEAQKEQPQKDDLCGPFWITATLRALDVPVQDQDEAALASGTLLSHHPDDYRTPGIGPRVDYRLDLPYAGGDDHDAGTSARGISRAIAALSNESVMALPIRSEGPWHADALLSVLDAVADTDGVHVVANVATAEFADPSARTRIAAVVDEGVDPDLPLLAWDVGHFVALGGYQTGQHGSIVTVLDTSEALGAAGIYLQPAVFLARSLTRPGRSPGGLLIVGEPRVVTPIIASVTGNENGLTARRWD
jgi:hypothetical protein